ncbi:MAG: shikimate dehydrogenase [Chloroflexi bacterium]|nr:shikimate dehydrogenase [Chloroflexota bacterium]
MKILGLIGHPLKHSISPAFQQAALDYCKIDARYEMWEIEKDQLLEFVKNLKNLNCLGANVTIPYKEAVLPLLEEVDDVCRQIGAVNTIVNRNRKLTGYNTDAEGFMRALCYDGKFDIKGKKVFIMGAGGVARAAAYILIKNKAASLTIANIIPGQGQALVDFLNRYSNVTSLCKWEDRGKELNKYDLIVNCTSLGMKHSIEENNSPLTQQEIPCHSLVFDVVYNPQETPLIINARSAGARTLGGLSMLVYQGAVAFELWTGQKAPVDIMMKSALEALKTF